MLEIIPNKSTGDVIREMDDHQLAILFSAWRGKEFNFLLAVQRAVNFAPLGKGRTMEWERFLAEPIWDSEGQIDDAYLEEEEHG